MRTLNAVVEGVEERATGNVALPIEPPKPMVRAPQGLECGSLLPLS